VTFYFPKIYFINLISAPSSCLWPYVFQIDEGAGSYFFSQKIHNASGAKTPSHSVGTGVLFLE